MMSIDGQYRYATLVKKHQGPRPAEKPDHTTPRLDSSITEDTRLKLLGLALHGDLQPAWKVRVRYLVAVVAVVVVGSIIAWGWR